MATKEQLAALQASAAGAVPVKSANDLLAQIYAQQEQEPDQPSLASLKAATLAAKQSFGKDIKGVGNVASNMAPVLNKVLGMRLSPEQIALAKKEPNIAQKFGGYLENLTPEQQKLIEEHKIAGTVGNIAGQVPGFLATGALVPGGNIVKGGKLARAGIEALRTGAQQGLYDVATDKGFNPANIALAFGIGGGLKMLPSIKNLRPKAEKVIQKSIKDVPSNQKIAISKVIGPNLTDDSIEAIVKNPKVRSYVADNPYIESQVPELTKTAKDSVLTTIKDINKAGVDLYKKAGITNAKPVTLTQTSIDDLVGKVNKFKQFATASDAPLIKKADEIVDNVMGKLDKGKIPFGALTRQIKDLENLSSIAGRGGDKVARAFYTDLNNVLRTARDTIPELGKASKKYANIKQAERLIKDVLKFNRPTGEKGIERVIARLTTELGNKTNKEMLENAATLLKGNPATAKAAQFLDDIKLAQTANDISKAKAITPQGLGRLPVLKHIANVLPVTNPQVRAQMLAKMSRQGIINPEAITKEVAFSKLPMVGKAITGLRARKELYNLPSIKNIPLPGIPKVGSPALQNAINQAVINKGTYSITDIVGGMRQRQKEQRQENHQNSNIPLKSVG